MSDEKVERILASYKPVEGRPGYVWVSHDSIAELKIVREIYEEYFGKVGEVDDKGISTEQ